MVFYWNDILREVLEIKGFLMTKGPLKSEDLEYILGEDLFYKLLGPNPFRDDDKSKARLELIRTIVDNLQGSYNNQGVRRWFKKNRNSLQGKSFINSFPNGWEANDEMPYLALKLSKWLTN